MPRSGGVYTLPAGNPVVTLTVISSAWANTTMSDIATALTGSLPTDGTAAMTGALRLVDGAVNTPGLTWATETTSGWYRIGANQFGFSVAGVLALSVNANRGWTIPTPASGVALTVNGVGAGSNALQINVAAAANGVVYDSTSGTGAYIRFTASGTASGFIGFGSAVISGAALGDLCLTSNGNTLRLGAGAGASTALAIANAGNVTINAPSSGTTLAATGAPSTSTVFALTAGASGGAGISANDGTGTYIFGSGILVAGVWSVYDSTHATERFKISSAGNVTIAAPSSGIGLVVNSVAGTNNFAIQAAASTSTGNSYGLRVNGGTNSSDICMLVQNASASTTYFEVFGDGGMALGSPTGGDQGLGTLNATGLFVNGVSVSPNGKVKAANTNRISTTVATNDPDLTFAIPVAGTYKIEVIAQVSANGSVTNGIAADINFSGTITAGTQKIAYTGSAEAIATGGISATPGATVGGNTNLTVGAGVAMILVEAILVAGGAGTVAFAWAQFNSVATNTTVLAGSAMSVTRIA